MNELEIKTFATWETSVGLLGNFKTPLLLLVEVHIKQVVIFPLIRFVFRLKIIIYCSLYCSCVIIFIQFITTNIKHCCSGFYLLIRLISSFVTLICFSVAMFHICNRYVALVHPINFINCIPPIQSCKYPPKSIRYYCYQSSQC